MLQELADLINKKWPEKYNATVFEPGALEVDWQRDSATWYEDDTDFYSAEFIVWALDRLLELGFRDVRFGLASLRYTLNIAKLDSDTNTETHCPFSGTTRSEAIAKALLHALKSEVG